MTTIGRPRPRSQSHDEQDSHPHWCDRTRCHSVPGIGASHRTAPWRLIPAMHWDNEVSVSCEHDVLPVDGHQETCVELQVALTRYGRSQGDDPETVASLVRLSHVEALQLAAALITHAHRIALGFGERPTTT